MLMSLAWPVFDPLCLSLQKNGVADRLLSFTAFMIVLSERYYQEADTE